MSGHGGQVEWQRQRKAQNGLSALYILGGNYLFRDLPRETLERAWKLATTRSFSAGQTIFSQGDLDGGLYCVASGRVRISASGSGGREVFFNILEAGETLGEIAAIDGLARTATATAVDDSLLIHIGRREFLELLDSEPKLVLNMLRVFCTRVRWTSELAEESALLQAPARLAKRMLFFAGVNGTPTGDSMQLRISQSELAGFLGISRQFVNRHLQEWRSKGWIELGRAKITIHRPEELQRLVDESERSNGGDSK
jgi:CRP/FNR family cyclic AMP-dependent transcriptional regulator